MLNDSCWCQSPLHGCRPRTMWHDPVRQLKGASHLLGSTSASRCKTFTRSLHVRLKTGALQADVTAGTCSARKRQLLLSIPTPSWAAMPGCTPCSLRHPLLHLVLQVLPVADCTAVSMVVHYACEGSSSGLACVQLQLDLDHRWEAALRGGRSLAAAKVTLVGMLSESAALAVQQSCQSKLLSDRTRAAQAQPSQAGRAAYWNAGICLHAGLGT